MIYVRPINDTEIIRDAMPICHICCCCCYWVWCWVLWIREGALVPKVNHVTNLCVQLTGITTNYVFHVEVMSVQGQILVIFVLFGMMINGFITLVVANIRLVIYSDLPCLP